MTTVKSISEALGVEVNVDLSKPVKPDGLILDLLNKHGALLFRNQKMTKPEFIAATRNNFGEPEIHPTANARDAEHPEMIILSNYGPRGDQPPKDEKHVVGEQLWHTDIAYLPRPNRASILYAREVPPVGGLTGLVDRQKAYADLPERLKNRIEGLNVYHSWKFTQELWAQNPVFTNKDGTRSAELDRYEDLIFPLVYVHPGSKQKVLNIAPQWSAGIPGMSDEEGRKLLHELITHTLQPQYMYWHKYQLGDVLVLDNWRMMHAATGTIGKYRRVMWRTSVTGTVTLGRKLTAAEKTALQPRAPLHPEEISACVASVPAAA